MADMPEILPCPFCGSPAVLEELPSGLTKEASFSVGCDSKSEGACMGYQSLTTFSRRSDAINAWNRRSPTT